MHKECPNIIRLAVHLPNMQSAIFGPGASLQGIVDNPPDSMLTAWFKYNAANDDAADSVYQDMPITHTYDAKLKKWKRRTVSLHQKYTTIGRMYFVGPRDVERFCLRLLLHHVAGAQSFAALRTYQSVEYVTFKEAAQKRGLLQDDTAWDNLLSEAATSQMGAQLRQLFATILVYNQPTEPEKLWNKHREALCDDLLRDARQQVRR